MSINQLREKFSKMNTEAPEMSRNSFDQTTKTQKKPTKEEDITQTRHQLDNLIFQLNGKLVNHFQQKQEKLLEEYRQELISAQKQLNDLKANTNQQQIKNKMIKRKKQLEKERHDLIEANMFFSNKCQMYKKKLAGLISQGKQLEKQVLFLEGQLDSANKKKTLLKSAVQHNKQNIVQMSRQPSELQIFSAAKPKPNVQTQLNSHRKPLKKAQEQSGKKIATSQQLKNLKNSVSLSNGKKNRKMLNYIQHTETLKHQQGYGDKNSSKIFEKTDLQRLFEDTVERIKQKRKNKRTAPLIKGQEFTDYQKKLIMQEFLGNQNVKKKIYEIIFDKSKSQNELAHKKIKIGYEDIEP